MSARQGESNAMDVFRRMRCRGLLWGLAVTALLALSMLPGGPVSGKPAPSPSPKAKGKATKGVVRKKPTTATARKAPRSTTRREAANGVKWVGVTVNGRKAAFRAAMVGGTSYIPMQAAADTFGARIEWDSATGAVAVNGSLLRSRVWRYKNQVYLPVGPLARLLRMQARYTARTNSLALGTSPVAATPQGPRTTPSPAPVPVRSGPFVPREATDGVFNVTVTDLQQMDVIKGYYRPRPGEKFVMVSVSQQNVSSDLQIYTGRFVLLDDKGQAHDALENLSNFWLVILRPGGTNFGYLMYEIPVAARPAHLVLDTRERAPLQVPLL